MYACAPVQLHQVVIEPTSHGTEKAGNTAPRAIAHQKLSTSTRYTTTITRFSFLYLDCNSVSR